MSFEIRQNSDIFEGDPTILVNPVNCMGISGKGLALDFARRFPSSQEKYRNYCNSPGLRPGRLLEVTVSEPPANPLRIIYFPTKDRFYNPSKYIYIVDGLTELNRILGTFPYDGQIVHIPALGCGLGGLDFEFVRILMQEILRDCSKHKLVVFPPVYGLPKYTEI